MEKARSYTLEQLALMYDISPEELSHDLSPIRHRFVKGHQARIRRYYPRDFDEIQKYLGPPKFTYDEVMRGLNGKHS